MIFFKALFELTENCAFYLNNNKVLSFYKDKNIHLYVLYIILAIYINIYIYVCPLSSIRSDLIIQILYITLTVDAYNN